MIRYVFAFSVSTIIWMVQMVRSGTVTKGKHEIFNECASEYLVILSMILVDQHLWAKRFDDKSRSHNPSRAAWVTTNCPGMACSCICYME